MNLLNLKIRHWLNETIAHAERGNFDEARKIIAALNGTINMDHGGEMAFNLLRIYIFSNRRLADAIGGDLSGQADALRVLRVVRDAYNREAEIEGQQAS
jgi:flagellin-specific chaperone FliS